MNSNNKAFLETTAIIDFIYKEKHNSGLTNLLANYDEKITSNYVKMEIKKGYLQHIVLLHNKTVQCNNIGEVHLYLNRLSSTPSRNRLATILETLGNFYIDMNSKYGSSSHYTTEERSYRQLRMYLRTKIRRCFSSIDRKVDHVINPMSCYVDIQPPREAGKVFENRHTSCRRSATECQIKKFFIDNENSFTNIRDKLLSIPNKDIDKETNNRITSIRNILPLLKSSTRPFSNREPIKTVKRCWYCSDAILAVTAPDGYDVINRNKKHYDPICESIGKNSVSY